MSEVLALLSGWGLGSAPLRPLAQALEAARPGARVELVPLPQMGNAEAALTALDQVVPAGAWLLGWSLGGMLATALAARRGTACPGLVTFASNPCFVAREDWPAAMAPEVFDGFAQLCATDRAATLKRFSLLCAQGSPAARGLARQLAEGGPAYADSAALGLLAALDNRAAVARLRLPQLHLFAEADALVPIAAATALGKLAPGAIVAAMPGCHAWVNEAATEVAVRVAAFIEEAA
ncbi:alpha/beta fold hydrolase [Pseudomonas massiliensis]|uniref:alpha/beta fold hydrolase n=1 Tax=Pseudomonas massiliensis TaxID=522492 RepID=UPI00058E2A5F|nr:alpha/beta fold hydrolase [Pseudomonas massiliensis]